MSTDSITRKKIDKSWFNLMTNQPIESDLYRIKMIAHKKFVVEITLFQAFVIWNSFKELDDLRWESPSSSEDMITLEVGRALEEFIDIWGN